MRLATPYYAAEYNVRQRELDPTIRNNIRVTYYESGHMAYLNQSSAKQLKVDIARFIASTERLSGEGTNQATR